MELPWWAMVIWNFPHLLQLELNQEALGMLFACVCVVGSQLVSAVKVITQPSLISALPRVPKKALNKPTCHSGCPTTPPPAELAPWVYYQLNGAIGGGGCYLWGRGRGGIVWGDITWGLLLRKGGIRIHSTHTRTQTFAGCCLGPPCTPVRAGSRRGSPAPPPATCRTARRGPPPAPASAPPGLRRRGGANALGVVPTPGVFLFFEGA